MEKKIREALIKRGATEGQACRDAFLYIEAIKAGNVEPETIRALIGE